MRLLALVFLLTPAVVAAQGTGTGTLAGRVVDAYGYELHGANVILEGTPLGAATNPDGTYRVILIPPGSYRVTASFWGFLPLSETLTVTDEGAHALDFVLLEDKGVGDTVFVCGYCPSALMSYDPFASRVVSDGCGASVWLSDLPVER